QLGDRLGQPVIVIAHRRHRRGTGTDHDDEREDFHGTEIVRRAREPRKISGRSLSIYFDKVAERIAAAPCASRSSARCSPIRTAWSGEPPNSARRIFEPSGSPHMPTSRSPPSPRSSAWAASGV